MKKIVKVEAGLLPLLSMSAREADEILDHLSNVVREIGRVGGGIDAIHGMGLQYWTDRITEVIRRTDRFPAQQARAKRLLMQLRLSNRA